MIYSPILYDMATNRVKFIRCVSHFLKLIPQLIAFLFCHVLKSKEKLKNEFMIKTDHTFGNMDHCLKPNLALYFNTTGK